MGYNGFEQKRVERLRDMLVWRLEKGTNGHQQAEAESLAWALEVVEEHFRDCLGEGE